MKTNRLAGHELRNEGRVYGGWSEGYVNGPGQARCSCGKRSAELPNTATRKQWHREHKDDVRAGGGA